jgi:hypothetical protein
MHCATYDLSDSTEKLQCSIRSPQEEELLEPLLAISRKQEKDFI